MHFIITTYKLVTLMSILVASTNNIRVQENMSLLLVCTWNWANWNSDTYNNCHCRLVGIEILSSSCGTLYSWTSTVMWAVDGWQWILVQFYQVCLTCSTTCACVCVLCFVLDRSLVVLLFIVGSPIEAETFRQLRHCNWLRFDGMMHSSLCSSVCESVR